MASEAKNVQYPEYVRVRVHAMSIQKSVIQPSAHITMRRRKEEERYEIEGGTAGDKNQHCDGDRQGADDIPIRLHRRWFAKDAHPHPDASCILGCLMRVAGDPLNHISKEYDTGKRATRTANAHVRRNLPTRNPAAGSQYSIQFAPARCV